MASSTMTQAKTSTATKVLVGAAVAGAAAYGFMMLGDSGSSDPVTDPTTIQYCRNQCIVNFGDACYEREGSRCLEFADGRCVARERTESCDAQGRSCWDACDLRFAEAPGYMPPGYAPLPEDEVAPGYAPAGVYDETPMGYILPGYTLPGAIELAPGYIAPGMMEETPPKDLPPAPEPPVEVPKEYPVMKDATSTPPAEEPSYTGSTSTAPGKDVSGSGSDSSAPPADTYMQEKQRAMEKVSESAPQPVPEPPAKESFFDKLFK